MRGPHLVGRADVSVAGVVAVGVVEERAEAVGLAVLAKGTALERVTLPAVAGHEAAAIGVAEKGTHAVVVVGMGMMAVKVVAAAAIVVVVGVGLAEYPQ